MLSERFLAHLADAECWVSAWDANTSELCLVIEKEIGPETGSLIFSGVSFVHLPPRFTVFAASSSQQEVPDFPGVTPESGEWLYLFQDAWSHAYYVLAESSRYELK